MFVTLFVVFALHQILSLQKRINGDFLQRLVSDVEFTWETVPLTLILDCNFPLLNYFNLMNRRQMYCRIISNYSKDVFKEAFLVLITKNT